MNNDLEQFSEERLQGFIDRISVGNMRNSPTLQEMLSLYRIALAAKQAKPVGYADHANLESLKSGKTIRIGTHKNNVMSIALYTTPPANSPAIPDGWVKCSDRMPEHKVNILAVTACGSIWTAFYNEKRKCWDDGDYYDDIKDITHWMPLPAAPKPESE